MSEKRRDDLRNIAIIAHVDHGKTTLVDALLHSTGEFKVKSTETQECVLDSNDLERERGITILAKNTSVPYKDKTINVVDTPGHADFSSEVERILRMVEGTLLVVDAVEGPMPQTRFVLQKSLQMGLKTIVVINKMDRPGANPHRALDRVFDLFVSLKATDKQLDFPYVFASGREGWARRTEEATPDSPTDMKPLLDLILTHFQGPVADVSKPMQMLVTMLEWNNFVGQVSVGRVFNGVMKMNQPIVLMRRDGTKVTGRVTQLQKFYGLSRRDTPQVEAGDIAIVAGLSGVRVGDTMAAETATEPLPPIEIEEPTMSVEVAVNDSLFVGQDGEFLTSRYLRERLFQEQETNAGLRVEERGNTGIFKVSGRGELHLTVLIETMRREGYEMSVSKPEVILHEENGQVMEPAETVILDIEEKYQGAVMESMGHRGAQMKDMAKEDRVRLEYVIATRCLLGFKNEFLILTKGTGVMHQSFFGFIPKGPDMALRINGVLIAMEAGESTGYALNSLQDRSTLFISPRAPVYEGLLVGENARPNDMVVNPCKKKALTNMRAAGSDDLVLLAPPRLFSLEQAIEYIEQDELVEVTPKNIRLRKKFLNEHDRKRASKN
jgi:GTP-binding protein